MRKHWLHKLLFGSIAIGLVLTPALLLVPQPADGTSDAMFGLPAYEKYRCALCHTSATPVVRNSDLNAFGLDFDENGRVWDVTLALKNSDGDRCSNGFELGDQNGDGILDEGGSPRERSNPGDPSDCTVALDPVTWGIIKDIFSREMPR